MIAVLAKSADKSREIFRNSSLMRYDFVYVGSEKKINELGDEITGLLHFKDCYEHKHYEAMRDELRRKYPDLKEWYDWRDMP